MIYAVGHDIVENERIANLLNRYGSRGLRRILTGLEFEIYLKRDDKVKFLAKRFAAKEAFAKACGTGLRSPVLLSNISVANDKLGRPYFVLASALQDWLKEKGIIAYHLSISDERSLSSAVVILEK